MGILLFVLKHVYFLASEDDKWVFPWPAKIMVSPFKVMFFDAQRNWSHTTFEHAFTNNFPSVA